MPQYVPALRTPRGNLFRCQQTLLYVCRYSDYTPDLDFRKVNLPSLRSLFLHCAPIRSVEFTQANTPKLKSLNLDHCRSVIAFKLDLPELEQVSVDFMEVQDARGFGRSLSSCPKLTQFTAYKLWGLSGTVHKLDLPECGWLSLHRSDDLEGLNICAPKLESLELRGCYSLECVRILPDPEGTTPKPLQVNLINANIDRVSKQHLKTHPRVKAPGGKFITKESQDEFASMFFESGMTASEDEESDDENDGPMIGMEGFLQMMHMMGQHAQMDPQIAAMMMQGGPFGPLGGMFAHDEADDYHDDGNEDEYETDSEGGAIDHDPDHDNPDHDTPDHDDPDHDDPDHDDADHDDSDQQDHDGPGFPGGMGPIPGVPAGFSAMLAMAMMNGMPVGMAMDGLHMMAAGYGDDSGSLSDGEEGDDDDEYVSGEGEGDGEPNGGPSCVVEEVE
eukprot:GHUV01028061.1.p1 GENE.GHUV01028061.1~~GHUV01028061.1.p1  ORF type:complete len:446 (+),score=47.57 GHUV01028061.1:163-1500(+)